MKRAPGPAGPGRSSEADPVPATILGRPAVEPRRLGWKLAPRSADGSRFAGSGQREEGMVPLAC